MPEDRPEGLADRVELEKLTATKLRELSIEKYPEIQGVSGMKKEEIIEAIIAEEVRLGLRPKTDAISPKTRVVADFKAQIRLLKRQRNEALAAQNREGFREARVSIKRLKRRLRKLREVS